MSSTAVSNNFSFFVGAFGLLSTVVSIVFCGRFLLPSEALKTLDATYHETNDLYTKAIADNLLPDAHFRAHTERLLIESDGFRHILREGVCQAVTIWGEMYGFLIGLTHSIWGATKALRELRCRIVTTTQETRRRLEMQNRRNNARSLHGSSDQDEYSRFLPEQGSSSSILSNTSRSLSETLSSLFNFPASNAAEPSAVASNSNPRRFCIARILRLHHHKDELPVESSGSPSASGNQIACGTSQQTPPQMVDISGGSLSFSACSYPLVDMPSAQTQILQVPPPALSMKSMKTLEYLEKYTQ